LKVAILQSNYIPWKGYFHLIHDSDVFVFYDEVKYTKNDWRNRNLIYTKNGKQWITIPIAKDAVKHRISEVTIDNPAWQELHYKTLYFGYKGAPHFPQLQMLMEEFYQQKKWTHLSKLNQYAIERIAKLIGIETKFIDSSQLSLEGDRVMRLINILKQVGATVYYSGRAAESYLTGQEHFFADNNIQLVYKDYPEYPVYPQLSSPFEQHLSIVDMIANVPFDKMKKFIYEF
jgi:hypothetical protein